MKLKMVDLINSSSNMGCGCKKNKGKEKDPKKVGEKLQKMIRDKIQEQLDKNRNLKKGT